MSRIQLACYCLLASAFLLGGLLVVQLGDRFETEAHASMVVNQQNFTLMTASTRSNEEALFVMDDNSGQLMIYKTEVARERIELAAIVPMRQLFRGEDVGTDFRVDDPVGR